MQTVRKIRAQRTNHNRRTRRRTATRTRASKQLITVIRRQTAARNDHQPPDLHQLRLQGNRKGRNRHQEEERRHQRGRRLKTQLLNIQGRAVENIDRAHRGRNANHQAQEAHARRHETTRSRHREAINRVLHGTHQTRSRQEHNHARSHHQGRRNRLPLTLQHRKNGPFTTQPNRQEGHQTRTSSHTEERRNTNRTQPLNQQVHRNKNDHRTQRRCKTCPQRCRQGSSTRQVRQPHHQRRKRLGAVRNLVQLQIGDFQGHTAASDLIDQAVHFRKRFVVLRRGTHHTHQGMGEALLSVRIALGDAGLHVNIGVRRVVDGHRLVRNVDFHRVQPVRRRHRNNRRVHVHCVRAVVEHCLRQAQGEVQGIACILLLTAERFTALMLVRPDRRHELALRNALGTARSGGCRLLSAHEGAEAT